MHGVSLPTTSNSICKNGTCGKETIGQLNKLYNATCTIWIYLDKGHNSKTANSSNQQESGSYINDLGRQKNNTISCRYFPRPNIVLEKAILIRNSEVKFM